MVSEAQRAGHLARVGAPAWTLRSVAAALLLTVAVFVSLPCLERMKCMCGHRSTLTRVDSMKLPPPPPVPRREPPRPQARERTRELPKPRLAAMRREIMPVSAALDLDLSLGDVAGDFDLSFATVTDDALRDVGDAVFELAEIDESPVPLVQVRPLYPAHARARKLDGVVVLEFTVGVDGKTRDIRAVSSSPPGVFVGPAVRAARRWRFRPGTRAGDQVAVRVRQKITFRLED